MYECVHIYIWVYMYYAIANSSDGWCGKCSSTDVEGISTIPCVPPKKWKGMWKRGWEDGCKLIQNVHQIKTKPIRIACICLTFTSGSTAMDSKYLLCACVSNSEYLCGCVWTFSISIWNIWISHREETRPNPWSIIKCVYVCGCQCVRSKESRWERKGLGEKERTPHRERSHMSDWVCARECTCESVCVRHMYVYVHIRVPLTRRSVETAKRAGAPLQHTTPIVLAPPGQPTWNHSKVSSLCDTVNRVVCDFWEFVPIHSTAQRSRLDIRGLAQVARRGNGGLKVWPRCGTVSPRQLAPGMCPQECIQKTPLCIWFVCVNVHRCVHYGCVGVSVWVWTGASANACVTCVCSRTCVHIVNFTWRQR